MGDDLGDRTLKNLSLVLATKYLLIQINSIYDIETLNVRYLYIYFNIKIYI